MSYQRNDRVLLGVYTRQDPVAFSDPHPMDLRPVPPRYGPSGPLTRYFVPATVRAYDREAEVLVVWTGPGCHECLAQDLVPYDESLPRSPADAHRRALHGEVF